MAVNGHLVTDDSSRDPYVETVQRGINYLLANLTSSAIGVQRFGDPDGNHNGIGLSVPGDRPVYETGPVMDALVAATRKELVATVGEPNVKGRALYDIMQDLVDMYCWGQSDADWGGGWRYSWNSDADNSACQWAAIGLMAAERYWGIAAPDWVKQRNLVWLNTSKGGSGFGYAGAGDGEATTPSGLVQAAFDGVKNTDTLWLHGENYVANNWTSLMNNNNLYAHYATVKALRAANPPVQKLTATGLDWFLDSSVGLGRNTIDRQHADGSWLSNDGNANDPSMSTAWSVMILSSSLFQRGPVAIASARPNPTAVGFPVVLDGRGSFHQHPALKVAEYRWDFDASDGLDFDHPDAVGAVVTNKFGHYGTNVVTLQVRDNGTPQLSSTASIEVRATLPPYPPTPDAGGPYLACAGETIHLDGSGSFDVDAAQGDYIQSYDWEISFQMPLDFNDGVTGAHAVITNGFATSGQHRIGLRVKDATSIVFPQLGKADMTSDAFTIAYVYDRIITNLVGRAKDNMIQLVWTKAGDYAVIQRSTLGPDRGFQEIGRTDSSYATFLDTNVDYNVSYYYRLYAYQAGHADPLGISDAAYVVSIPRSFESCGPYFTAYPPREIAVGKLYEVALQARERQNNPFGFALLLGPTNMTLDAASGIVRFTPTIDQLGGNLVSFAVTNSCGTNVLPFTLTVFNVTNLPPLATANGPYTGVAGLPLQFSSVGTRDPDTNALTYVWVFGDGVIDTNANPTHAYPAQGDYSVSLYVNDGHGGTATAYTRATISRANRIPIAKAGADQMPLVGQTVMLDGSGSWDADLDPLTYRWDVVLRPTNSVSLLTNSTTARPSLLIDQPGFYVVRLTVNDGLADSDPDAVTLVTANSVPIANAGSNQRVLEGQTARLDGTRSYDVDHNPLTYRWTLLSVPVGSAAALTNANTATPTFGLDVYGLYIAQLIVNDGLVDSAPARVRVTTGNLLPEIVSAPSGTNAVFGYTWNYNVLAYDPDGTNLTFTLAQAPTGMTLTPQPPVIEFGETNSALISWTPTLAQEGAHPVRIRVTDADGASVEQAFTLVASRDTEPPQVSLALVQGQINPNNGQWSATLNSTAIIRVTATDNVEVTSLTLRVGSHLVPLNSSGVGSFVATNTGILQVVATASDAEGNVGTNTQTLYVRDPNAVSAVAVQIHSPTNTATITAPVGIYASITSAIPLSVCSLEYARLDSGTIDDSVSLSDPSLHYQSITNLIIPPGTLVLSNINVGRFDPTLLANDAYIIRLTALDMNLNGAMEGALVYVSGNLKYGEFHLDFTDLSVPVAGIPITITRSYDTRESTRQGDFGYGWTLGLADGHIVKSAMKYGFGLMGDERTLTTRTRVYITKPDGRRVGFTVKPEIPAGDGLMGYPPGYTLLFGQLYTPGFEPDPGVYDKLEAVGAPDLIISSDGAMVYPLFSFMGFDPDTFRLTTKDGTVYEYSQSQGLKNVTDLNTNRLVFTRDGIYHFSSGSTNYDQSVPFIRDAQGRISEIIDPAGNRITYAYDAQGDLRSFTDQVTNVTQYLYSTARAHYLTNIIDSLGRNALRLEYDSAGRLVGIRDALGNLTSQDFPDPNTAVFKDANGHTNIVRYDDNGNEVMKAIPGISTNYFAFDANNNQIWHQDARGFVTTRAYDSRGNLTNIVDALSNVTAIAYNELNKPTSVTDALGHTTRFGYNSKGQTTNAVNALGGQAFFNRDAQGRVTSVTDFNGHTAIFDYTGACSCSKPSRTINPDGTSRTYEYNPRGQTLRETDELGHSTFFAYDGGGHLLSVRNVMSNTTTYAYAGALKISETDPLGRTTYYAYDAVNRQIAITNAMGSVVRFEYDNGTNRTVVLDPVNNATRFYYDAANRLSHQVDSWGRTNSFAYDPSGNRIEAIDRNGRRRTFAYDGLNRSTNELWWEGTKLVRTIEFTYSVLGLLTGARDPASLLTFHFDAWNRLERAVQSGGVGLPEFTLTYAYDGVGNAVSVSDNLGVQLTSEYDVRDRLTRCVWQGGGIPGASIQFAYDATGNRTRILRAADTIGTNVAVQSYYSYNTVGAVTNIIHVNGTGVSLAEYQYQRDPAQQIILRATGNLLSSFTYDFTGQITNVTYSPPNQPAESYHYDANGNRIGGGYIVITNNQITANGALAYSYDAEGSLVARTNAFTGSRTAYAYDHRQRLVRVLDYDSSGNCTQTVDFGYDLLNRRTSKIVNGVVFRYLYDRESAWADLGPNGGVAVHYLVTGNLDDMIVRFRATEGLGWYLSDVVGTVRDISDSTGRIVSHLDYSEFGSLLSVTGSSSFDRFSFTGREFDQEIGLYFNRARFYDPNSHVFISEDPLGFVSGDFNLHRYANNNPISGRDRTGTVAMFEEGLQVGSSIGASTAAAPLGVLTGADAVGAAIAPDLAMLASAAEGSFAQQVFLAQIRSVIAGFIRSLPNRYLQELGVGFLKDWIRSTFGRKLSIMIFSGGWV